jgi:hypothetical protein
VLTALLRVEKKRIHNTIDLIDSFALALGFLLVDMPEGTWDASMHDH